MELTRQEKDIVRRKFCKYCIKVMEGEALYYLRQLEKQQEHDVCFSDLTPEQKNQLSAYDDLLEINYFQVMDKDVPVRDEDISDALKKLPEQKRMIILMAFFLDMTEQEIADYYHLVQGTVHYHKTDSLRMLKDILE
ncbi:sigma-70 family RNA polymerase sigma factor [Tissierella sp.]|uniref:sigma-70 family RNA polymerase sigma factor n=1 Tax=Tissierella sp. TaxID=41274 RepID=UPI003026E11D